MKIKILAFAAVAVALVMAPATSFASTPFAGHAMKLQPGLLDSFLDDSAFDLIDRGVIDPVTRSLLVADDGTVAPCAPDDEFMRGDADGDNIDDVCDPDDDNDGVDDEFDTFADSDIRQSIWIGRTNTFVPNMTQFDGVTFNDSIYLAKRELDGKGEGTFRTSVIDLASDWRRAGYITPRQFAAIVVAVTR